MRKKQNSIFFYKHQKQIKDFNVCIDNTLIERAESFNYLGIMLKETLSWKSHIEVVGKNISKVTGILYRLRNFFRKCTITICSYTIGLLQQCLHGSSTKINAQTATCPELSCKTDQSDPSTSPYYSNLDRTKLVNNY